MHGSPSVGARQARRGGYVGVFPKAPGCVPYGILQPCVCSFEIAENGLRHVISSSSMKRSAQMAQRDEPRRIGEDLLLCANKIKELSENVALVARRVDAH